MIDGSARDPEKEQAICMTCAPRCRDSAFSWVFFLIGLVATFSVRLVIVFMNYSVVWAKAAWYVGVLGFFIFFLYKFHTDRIRSTLIEQERLIEKARNREQMTDNDYAVMATVLCSLSSSKDRINYFIIFSTSIITVLLALYEDFLR